MAGDDDLVDGREPTALEQREGFGWAERRRLREEEERLERARRGALGRVQEVRVVNLGPVPGARLGRPRSDALTEDAGDARVLAWVFTTRTHEEFVLHLQVSRLVAWTACELFPLPGVEQELGLLRASVATFGPIACSHPVGFGSLTRIPCTGESISRLFSAGGDVAGYLDCGLCGSRGVRDEAACRTALARTACVCGRGLELVDAEGRGLCAVCGGRVQALAGRTPAGASCYERFDQGMRGVTVVRNPASLA